MKAVTEKLSTLAFTERDVRRMEDLVVKEFSLTIFLNDLEIATLICSPIDLDYLAIGFLLSDGLIKDRKDVKKIVVQEQEGIVKVKTGSSKALTRKHLINRLIHTGGGTGTRIYSNLEAQIHAKIDSDVEMTAAEVLTLTKEFRGWSRIYQVTHGIHSAALCESKKILLFRDDIGRHNAIDKIFGESLLKGFSTSKRLVITSGRVSSEILLKVAKRKIPIIASISATTDVAVELANNLGITLIGHAGGDEMRVYTHGRRIVFKER